MTRKIVLLTALFGLAIGNNVNASFDWNNPLPWTPTPPMQMAAEESTLHTMAEEYGKLNQEEFAQENQGVDQAVNNAPTEQNEITKDQDQETNEMPSQTFVELKERINNLESENARLQSELIRLKKQNRNLYSRADISKTIMEIYNFYGVEGRVEHRYGIKPQRTEHGKNSQNPLLYDILYDISEGIKEITYKKSAANFYASLIRVFHNLSIFDNEIIDILTNEFISGYCSMKNIDHAKFELKEITKNPKSVNIDDISNDSVYGNRRYIICPFNRDLNWGIESKLKDHELDDFLTRLLQQTLANYKKKIITHISNTTEI